MLKSFHRITIVKIVYNQSQFLHQKSQLQLLNGFIGIIINYFSFCLISYVGLLNQSITLSPPLQDLMFLSEREIYINKTLYQVVQDSGGGPHEFLKVTLTDTRGVPYFCIALCSIQHLGPYYFSSAHFWLVSSSDTTSIPIIPRSNIR